jgi:cystine transport system substrate-binding protein
MNKWIKRIVAISFVMTQFLVIPTVSASSLENIQSKKNQVEEEVTQLQAEVSEGLEEVSEISGALEQLNQEIEEHEETITHTEQDIEEQEILVNDRYEYTAEQLKAMQKSEVNQNIVLSVLQAESLTELLNAIYSASLLTDASEERLVEAQAEQEKLDDLKEKLVANQEELDAKQEKTVAQKETLDAKTAELSKTLAANQEELEQLNSEEASELRRIAEEEEAERRRVAQKEVEAEAAEAQKAKEAENAEVAEEKEEPTQEKEAPVKVASSKVSSAKEEPKEEKSSDNSEKSEKANNTNETKKSNTSSKETQTTESNSAGDWISVQATGYSTEEPGLSTHTATGIDLRVNPRVIAVDPSVIPLNSLVEVEGQGVFVAGDTGSAINGNIIDIHFSSVSQALSWGRRNVRVRVLN